MKQLNDQLEGPTTIDEDTILNGQVLGDLTVLNGVVLRLNGQVTGDLYVESGASAFINGLVIGQVFVEGRIDLLGIALGGVVRRSSAN